MDLPINQDLPLIMHVDLNSCFAILEQQANPLIRNKPVAIAAYDSPGGAIIASSYEAKALGIKLGLRVKEAKLIYPKLIVQTPDPDKYFDAHRRFKKLLLKYTDLVTPKSVDEFVLDFKGSLALQNKINLTEIGQQIKADVKREIGSYVTINVGIAPNRFLAKLAAGLNKPDGLDVLSYKNLLATYGKLKLIDLPGINYRYQARLNLAGIYSPLDFFKADPFYLKQAVFRSILGYYWYLRLRGYEIDQQVFGRKSYGQQYALGHKTKDKQEILKLIMKLSEKAGYRMRANNFMARSVYLFLLFQDHTTFKKYKKLNYLLYSTQDIYSELAKILTSVNIRSNVVNLSIALFNLTKEHPIQLGLFDDTRLDNKSLAQAMDLINNKYGEFNLIPARMANMQNVILKRVAFGNLE